MIIQRRDYQNDYKRQMNKINSNVEIKNQDKNKQLLLQRDNYSKTIISPYLSDLQVKSFVMKRNKKIKSVLRQKYKRDNSNTRDLSANKFRIQEISYGAKPRNSSTSTNKSILQQIKMKSALNTVKNNAELPKRNRKFQLYKKNIMNYYETIVPQSKLDSKLNQTFNDMYTKIKNINEDIRRQSNSCQKKYLQQYSGQNHIDEYKYMYSNPNLQKISQTVKNISNKSVNNSETQIKQNKKTITIERKNFRKGKYEYTHSEIAGNQQQNNDSNEKIPTGQVNYNSLDMHKKQSDSNFIKQLDINDEKEIQQQELALKHKLNKLLEKSLQKSTEEYFRQHPHQKKIKSRNQIQIFISTVKNPSINNKISQTSTAHDSDKKVNDRQNYLSKISDIRYEDDLILYDFSLENQIFPKAANKGSVKESFGKLEQKRFSKNQNDLFDKQRKQAQIKNCIGINQELGQISWSEQASSQKQSVQYKNE